MVAEGWPWQRPLFLPSIVTVERRPSWRVACERDLAAHLRLYLPQCPRGCSEWIPKSL